MLKRNTQQETANGLLINECEDFGAAVVVEPCEGNSAISALVVDVFERGDEVWDTSQAADETYKGSNTM